MIYQTIGMKNTAAQSTNNSGAKALRPQKGATQIARLIQTPSHFDGVKYLSLDLMASQLAVGALSTVFLLASPDAALAFAPVGERWDGESSAIGSCPLGEEGEQCRSQVLAKDKMLNYNQANNNSGKLSGKATGVPVSDINSSSYKTETLALADALKQYMTLDPYDDNRVTLVKTVKKEGLDWVSKYARGGSARAKSARTLYVVVDAVEGHLASNGYAPFPSRKAGKLIEDIDASLAFLAEGR